MPDRQDKPDYGSTVTIRFRSDEWKIIRERADSCEVPVSPAYFIKHLVLRSIGKTRNPSRRRRRMRAVG